MGAPFQVLPKRSEFREKAYIKMGLNQCWLLVSKNYFFVRIIVNNVALITKLPQIKSLKFVNAQIEYLSKNIVNTYPRINFNWIAL